MTAVASLQACLAAEHATLYGYGVLGGRLALVAPGSGSHALSYTAYGEHLSLRDQLTAVLRGLAAEPIAAEASYATPFAVESLADCKRLARLLEHRCSSVYVDAVADTLDQTRALVATALRDSAVRSTRWGASVQALPGIDDR